MIKNFTDHAANERTFLAWVRTAIAIVGFGIIVERINLFGAAETSGATATGLLLVGVGIALFAISAYRFLALRRQISEATVYPAPSVKADVMLAIVLSVLAMGVVVFALHIIGPGS